MQDGLTKRQIYDKCIREANAEFTKRSHNIVTNNCHHHVAHALNLMKYDGRENWTQVDIAKLVMFKGEKVK